MIDQTYWEKQLEVEGFSQIYVHQDPPFLEYPEHEHPVRTAHVILSGGMTIWSGGREVELRAGDRFDVLADVLHAARIGSEGCVFLIGIRT